MGRIDGIRPEPTYELTIADCGKVLHDCAIGDSIAVNGACLTVTEFDAKEGWFKVGLGGSFQWSKHMAWDLTQLAIHAAPETLSRTNLGALTKQYIRASWSDFCYDDQASLAKAAL